MIDVNVLSLFNGCSGAYMGLREAIIPIGKYYVSEIDKFANQAAKLMYPDSIFLGDVRSVDVSKLDRIDLVCGGSPCFVAGTMILTKHGYKPIESVLEGDFVLTHKNRYCKVVKVGNEITETINIISQGVIPTITTKDHPYYTRKMYRKWDNPNRTSYRHFDEPLWKNAGELSKGDFVGIPINQGNENVLNLTDDECLLIGRYIADGHTRKDYKKSVGRPNDRHWQIIISVGNHKANRFRDDYKLKHSIYPHSKSTHRAIFSSKRLVQIVEAHCGCGAANKKLSNALLNMPIDKLKLVIDGYMSGDGCFTNNKFKATTVSKELATSLTHAIQKCYRVGVNVNFINTADTHVIEGRLVNQMDQYIISFNKEVRRQVKYRIIDDIVWYPFKSMNNCGLDTVYNLQVDEDNSYTANNAIVHNCTDLSFAGKQSGLICNTLDDYMELRNEWLKTGNEDLYFHNGKFQQSILFWEYVRILRDLQKINPNVKFFLENVDMKKKEMKIINDNLGLSGQNLNSNLVSAQNRNRWYWSNISTILVGLFGDIETYIEPPKDRKIFLKDIIEHEVDEKYYIKNPKINFEGVNLEGKANALRVGGRGSQDKKHNFDIIKCDKKGNIKHDQKKASCYTAGGNSGGNHSDMDLIGIFQKSRGKNKGGVHNEKCPIVTSNSFEHNNHVCVAQRGRNIVDGKRAPTEQRLEPNLDGKTNCITTVHKDNYILTKNYMQWDASGKGYKSQQDRVYYLDGKHGTLPASKCQEKTGVLINDGIRYRLRRLTEREVMRLQTVPLWAQEILLNSKLSSTQLYKQQGNGWSIEMIVEYFKLLKK